MATSLRLIAPVLFAVVLAAPSPGPAQPRSAEETERERAIVDALRREDPAEADRYVALSNARAQAIADLRRAEAQYNAAGPELRSAFSAPLRRAQRTFAETSLALLDFFDARERRAIARYHEEIQRINTLLEDATFTRRATKMLGLETRCPLSAKSPHTLLGGVSRGATALPGTPASGGLGPFRGPM